MLRIVHHSVAYIYSTCIWAVLPGTDRRGRKAVSRAGEYTKRAQSSLAASVTRASHILFLEQKLANDEIREVWKYMQYINLSIIRQISSQDRRYEIQDSDCWRDKGGVYL